MIRQEWKRLQGSAPNYAITSNLDGSVAEPEDADSLPRLVIEWTRDEDPVEAPVGPLQV